MTPPWATPVILPSCPQVGEDAPRLFAHVETLPIFEKMSLCPQEARYHGEGDVLTHTQMVCDELVRDPRYATLDEEAREELWWAAILHDCGKPRTTRLEEGQMRSRGHPISGAVIARELLWRAGVAPVRRERVCALVRYHMVPYHLLDREDPRRQVIEISLSCRNDHLALLTSADARGRIAEDAGGLTDGVELFTEFCAEALCLDVSYPFASDHARVMFFRREERDPAYAAYDDSRGEVILLSGLPGAGKDRWVAKHGGTAAVVSLVALRRKDSVKRGDRRAEGRVYAQARELLREELRHGRPVIHNATNLSRLQRGPILALADDYNARVKIVCVECSPEELRKQNSERSHALPDEAIGDLLARWETPTLADAHTLVFAGE